jgi:RNA polymerase sigma factor (sigma-70 family)
MYVRYLRSLTLYLADLLDSDEDAEDVVQTALERLHAEDEPPAEPNKWLRTVSRNLALNILRKRRPVVPLSRELPSRTDAIGAIERRIDLARMMLRLSGPLRDVVLLKLDGLGYSEIAQRLGISEAAARQRSRSANIIMRARLPRRVVRIEPPPREAAVTESTRYGCRMAR